MYGNGQASFHDGTALLPSITNIGDLNTGMWFPAADTIAFSEGGVEALRIDSSGKVGINTTTMQSTFNVQGVDGNIANFSYPTAATELKVVCPTVNVIGIFTGTDDALTFGTDDTERMRVTSGGTLQIAGGGNDDVGEINMGNTDQDASRFQVRHQSSAWYLKTVDSEPLILGTANTERLRIDSSGNVLCGTTTVVSGSNHIVVGSNAIHGVRQTFTNLSTSDVSFGFSATNAGMYSCSIRSVGGAIASFMIGMTYDNSSLNCFTTSMGGCTAGGADGTITGLNSDVRAYTFTRNAGTGVMQVKASAVATGDTIISMVPFGTFG
jgi:uncharacterized protein YaiE (UPF0345 family)